MTPCELPGCKAEGVVPYSGLRFCAAHLIRCACGLLLIGPARPGWRCPDCHSNLAHRPVSSRSCADALPAPAPHGAAGFDSRMVGFGQSGEVV